jgi:hypothetical protein
MWISTLVRKDQAAAVIRDYQMRTESESSCTLSVLRTDRGGEFTSKQFAEYCAAEGVQWQLIAPYSPQQNGVVECRNAMVIGAARSMIKQKGLLDWFWGEAVVTVVYLLNRVPCKAIDGRTPFEVWYKKQLAVHHLKTFGCIVYVRNTKPHLKKLDDRGRKMIFVGYEKGTKAFRAYDPITQRVTISHDVIFDEGAQWDWSGDVESKAGRNLHSDGSFTVLYRVLGEEGEEQGPDMEGFAPADWGDHQPAEAEQASPGSRGVQQSPVIHYDNPLFDVEDQDADYHNETLRFRSIIS